MTFLRKKDNFVQILILFFYRREYLLQFSENLLKSETISVIILRICVT